MPRFDHFVFSGNPKARGLAYGETLRERVHATYALYADSLFSGSALSPDEIRARGDRVRQLIDDFDPALTTELDAVAHGAGLPAWQIYVLNARTEILNAPVGECTAAFFSGSATLGQNWDWVRPLESLAALVTWDLGDDRRLLVLTEPGMLGKIGFNDRGLGVCLNILFSAHALNGVPVHVLTRAVLDCGSVAEARALMQRSGFGKSSHLLVGDAGGDACSMEFAAGERFEVDPEDGVWLHTNHCVADAGCDKAVRIPTTVERLGTARGWMAANTHRDVAGMKDMLLDESPGAGALNVHYHPEPLLDNQDVGTCATIVMDLPGREMHIKRGPDDADFDTLPL